jgi:poly(A) polymerase
LNKIHELTLYKLPFEPQWSDKKDLQELLIALQPAMIVGGAVRNALMNLPITDIDIATTHKPEETFSIAKQHGFKVFPTGISHGTVTCVKLEAYEVTTLRVDEKTDGRHAQVRFSESWEEDAERRDFTINALYATFAGDVYDCVGGREDLAKGLIRFIGDPFQRIKEDYLRILRFFRFYAIYGKSYDQTSIQACYALAANLKIISRERCTAEFLKILKAKKPMKALSIMTPEIMDSAGLPKANFEKIELLRRQERELRFDGSYIALLSTFYDDNQKQQTGNKYEDELVLSRKERNLLLELKNMQPLISKKDYALWINSCSPEIMQDGFLVKGESNHLVPQMEKWLEVRFPVMGRDLLEIGVEAGPGISSCIKELLDFFCEQEKPFSKQELLLCAQEIIQKYLEC